MHFFIVYCFLISLIFSQDCVNDCPSEADGDCAIFQQQCLSNQACSWDPSMGTCYPTPANTTQPIGCESDLHNWELDYIGKSTQFRYYSACDKHWIKIKMEDLTEYDGSNDKKTGNKQTSFASTTWDWSDPNGQNVNYNNDPNYPAKKNTFQATLANGAYFELTSILFLKETEIKYYNNNSNTLTIAKYGIKWNVNINNWNYLSTNNYLRLCISMMDNGGNGGSKDDNKKDNKFKSGVTWNVGDFYLDSPDTALCSNNNQNINVVLENDGKNKQNKNNFCFKFDHCDGNIDFDPTISFNGNYGYSVNLSVLGYALVIVLGLKLAV